ncbi:MAG: secG [Bacillales bacterium]|jgi:preprotein translocase subunit SecG|nr:secG [Bacillales bacterium]
MHTALVILLVIVCILLIGVVLLQSGKSAGLGSIAGGAEQLFGKQKARGAELWLHRFTIGLVVVFFIVTIAIGYFSK